MNLSSTVSWFVAQTQPNLEAKAAENLARQGFEVYLPRYRKTVRHARRVSIVNAPLFPNYVFIRFDFETTQWRSINSTRGVSRLVGCETAPASLPADVVEGLKKREGVDGFFDVVRPHAEFKAGDVVRVCDGAFNSCRGIFEARTDKDRVAVLLDMLGRKSRVMLNIQSIEAA